MSEVKRFYDELGWKRSESGRLVDTQLFGVREMDGEIRRAAHAARVRRVCSALRRAGDGLRLLEMGCGGNPAMHLFDLASSYTGVDFSKTGIEEARRRAENAAIPAEFLIADVTSLPFGDGAFDAVYSAHCFYHIDDVEAQARAVRESIRVLRPGGVAVLVLANPRPLADPVRLAMRLAADTPVLGPMLRGRRKSVLPYRPMPIGWVRRRLEGADVEVTAYAMASTWTNQHISESSPFGRMVWRTIAWLETNHPKAAGRLGNFVMYAARKRGDAPGEPGAAGESGP